MSLETFGRLALDDPTLHIHDLFGIVHRSLHRRWRAADREDGIEETESEIDAFLNKLGWHIKEDAPGRRDLAAALLVLRRLGWQVAANVFDPYAQIADEIASWEIDQIPRGGPVDQSVENVVIGTVIFEVVLTSLRRLAEEHHSADRFARESGTPTRPSTSKPIVQPTRSDPMTSG